jgi:hypothetical protein
VALIVLSVLTLGLLLFIGGVMLAALAPHLLLVTALLFTLLLLVGGVYQTAGPRPRNYRREIHPADTSTGVFSMIGGSLYHFFYEQKLPPPTPRRKTTSRTATQRVATAKARRTKRRGGE